MIIPERANAAILAQCLEKVAAALRAIPEPSEAIVVVNGADAALYRALVQQHRQVHWIFSKEPLWYSGAIQRGLRAARFDWVYLLNSDMLLDASALESILRLRSPRVFAVASQVFFADPAKRREETGWTMFRPTEGPIEILDEVPEDNVTVRGTFYAGGGASLFRRYLLRRLARSSSVYAPFYWEDVEWGARAWRMGFESRYCPASRALHMHRMTNRLFFSEKEIDRILKRNAYVFHFRNGPSPASFLQFLRTLARVEEDSIEEILTYARIAQIAFGHFQSQRLPSDHVALDRTWQMCFGPVDDYIPKC